MTDEHIQRDQAEHPPDRIKTRWAVRESMGVMMTAAILFLAAGRFDWGMGWALVGLYLFYTLGTAIILMPRDSGLLAERLGPRRGTKTWDTVLLSALGLLSLVKYILAGLDQRNGWSTGISPVAQLVALLCALGGYALVLWAISTNAYFSLNVRIQTERGHQVARGGPYRFVRHPSYLGTALFELATPIMLGSWWALIPGAASALLFILRTVLEDRTLIQELPGYPAYAEEVRFRLLPGIW